MEGLGSQILPPAGEQLDRLDKLWCAGKDETLMEFFSTCMTEGAKDIQEITKVFSFPAIFHNNSKVDEGRWTAGYLGKRRSSKVGDYRRMPGLVSQPTHFYPSFSGETGVDRTLYFQVTPLHSHAEAGSKRTQLELLVRPLYDSEVPESERLECQAGKSIFGSDTTKVIKRPDYLAIKDELARYEARLRDFGKDHGVGVGATEGNGM